MKRSLDERPRVVLLAGPNGAGKTTVAPRLLTEHLAVGRFVNADTIAAGLDAFSPRSVAITAGRVMLERLKVLAVDRESFAFETTLASRSFAPWLRSLQDDGYLFSLIFIAVRSPEMACARVADRVRMGGHFVGDEVVHRRFHRGLLNFFTLYRPLADKWWFYDSSGPGKPVLIAKKETASGSSTVAQPELWTLFQEAASES